MYYTYRFYSIGIMDWGFWGPWSTCSKTCGSGVWKRYRSCRSQLIENGDSNCQRNYAETTSCLTIPCPGIH